MRSLKESLKRYLKKKLGIDVLEIYVQTYEKQIGEMKSYLDKLQETMGSIDKKTEELSNIIDKKISELESNRNYFGDTLAEHAYKISMIENKVEDIEILGERQSIKLFEAEHNNDSGGKIIQIVNVLKNGDAIGDMIRVIDRCLKKNGIESEIYAYENETDYQYVKKLDIVPKFSPKDVLVFHMTPGRFADLFTAYSGKKILYYHNITPAKYFEGYNKIEAISSDLGYGQIKKIKDDIDQCIVDSEYNKQELKNIGYHCPIEVMNVPIDFSKFDFQNNIDASQGEQDSCLTFLYVGRIVPHKKIEDIIEFYNVYRKNIDASVHLIIVGAYNKNDMYYQYLQDKIGQLGILENDIEFKGHVDDKELGKIYQKADVYISMSEHEGFCVPIVEAMFFQKVIVAYNAGAVKDTLANGGILVDNKDYEKIAEYLSEFLKDSEKRNNMKICQETILEKYSLGNAEKKIISYFKKLGVKND